MPKLQELFTTGSAPEQILTDIYRTVVEATKTELVGTNFLAMRFGPQDIPGSSLDVVHQTKNSLSVGQIGEGAEIPIATEDTFKFSVRPRKYGVRPLVTREMTEDSLFAVMERNLREAGYQMAKQLDKLLMTALRQGSGNTITGGANITIANITQAINNLEKNDFRYTDFPIGADVAWDLRNIDTFVEANKAGITNPSQSLIGTIFGGKVWQTNQFFSTVDAASANNTDAAALDRNWALAFAEKRPIMVERYDDVTRQLLGIAITSRWDAVAVPSTEQSAAPYTTTAISLITTT